MARDIHINSPRPTLSRSVSSQSTTSLPSDSGGPSCIPPHPPAYSEHNETDHQHSMVYTEGTGHVDAPPRPPRNPARSTIQRPPTRSRKDNSRGRPSTATGAREDITPWEFFPVPADDDEASKASDGDATHQRRARATGRVHSSVPSMSFANFLRRRKSTGGGSSKRDSSASRASQTRSITVSRSETRPPATSQPQTPVPIGVFNGVSPNSHASASTSYIPYNTGTTVPASQYHESGSPTLTRKSSSTQASHSANGALLPPIAQPPPLMMPHSMMYSPTAVTSSQPFLPSSPTASTTSQPPASSPKTPKTPSNTSPTSVISTSPSKIRGPISHNSQASQALSTNYRPPQHQSPRHNTSSYTPGSSPQSSRKSEKGEPGRAPLDLSAPRFSTADRTILAELRRNMDARASQFVVKGSGTAQGVGMTDSRLSGPGLGDCEHCMGPEVGRRHHPFTKEEVPYPRSYGREVLDHDVWETAFCQQMCGSVTWHVFSTPPTKVLDLGCGTGSWILDCARQWRNCHFVGLDVVPLHPNLQQIGLTDLASRISWVQANFLDGLPFPNEEFDYVHIKRIARGVPEDKWDMLLEEICRVMKPGAAFEMVEEELFFPGKLIDKDGDSEPNSANFRDFPDVLDGDHSSLGTCSGSASVTTSVSQQTTGSTPVTPTTSTPALLTLAHGSSQVIASDDDDDLTPRREFNSPPAVHAKSPPAPQHLPATMHHGVPRPALPPIQVGTAPPPPQVSPSVSVQTKATRSPREHPMSQPRFADSAISLINGAIGTSPSATGPGKAAKAEPSGLDGIPIPNAAPDGTPDGLPSTSSYGTASNFLRTAPKAPPNPRDHSLLELIYNEMHAARFINLAPISLLANALGLYFKDVRTHPPLQWTFPPRSRMQPVTQVPSNTSSSDTEESSSDDDPKFADRPFRPRYHPKPSTPSQRRRAATLGSQDKARSESTHEQRWVSMRSLIEGDSKYISLDQSQFNAFSPSIKASFPSPVREGHKQPPSPDSRTARMSMAMLKSRLPNTTMNLDLNNLNLHLMLRIAEVLACAEAMWEWVVEYQAGYDTLRTLAVPRGGGRRRASTSLLLTSSTREHDELLSELTRDEFDALLTKFELDMSDEMGLGKAMEQRFGWHTITTAPTLERKQFDSACEKWAQWQKLLQEREQEKRQELIQPLPLSQPYGTRTRAVQKQRRPQTAQSHTGTPSSVADNDDQDQEAVSGSLTQDSSAATGPATVLLGPQTRNRRFSHYDDGKGGLRRSGSLLAGSTMQTGATLGVSRQVASLPINDHGGGHQAEGQRKCTAPTLQCPSPFVPPERRLSRVTRVFVAWKP